MRRSFIVAYLLDHGNTSHALVSTRPPPWPWPAPPCYGGEPPHGRDIHGQRVDVGELSLAATFSCSLAILVLLVYKSLSLINVVTVAKHCFVTPFATKGASCGEILFCH
jgi:hypothetical protein